MKRQIFIYLILLMGAITVKAQKAPFARVDSLDRRPLIIINDKIVDPLSFLALDKQDFKSFKVFTPEQAVKKFGNNAGKFGAVEIILNKTAKIFTWPELAKRFYFIPGQMPADARLYYGYFAGLDFNDPRLFITSVSTAISLGVQMKDFISGKPIVIVGVKNHEGDKSKATATLFDKDIEAVKKIFDDEEKKRIEIENAKPRLEG